MHLDLRYQLIDSCWNLCATFRSEKLSQLNLEESSRLDAAATVLVGVCGLATRLRFYMTLLMNGEWTVLTNLQTEDCLIKTK